MSGSTERVIREDEGRARLRQARKNIGNYCDGDRRLTNSMARGAARNADIRVWADEYASAQFDVGVAS